MLRSHSICSINRLCRCSCTAPHPRPPGVSTSFWHWFLQAAGQPLRQGLPLLAAIHALWIVSCVAQVPPAALPTPRARPGHLPSPGSITGHLSPCSTPKKVPRWRHKSSLRVRTQPPPRISIGGRHREKSRRRRGVPAAPRERPTVLLLSAHSTLPISYLCPHGFVKCPHAADGQVLCVGASTLSCWDWALQINQKCNQRGVSTRQATCRQSTRSTVPPTPHRTKIGVSVIPSAPCPAGATGPCGLWVGS